MTMASDCRDRRGRPGNRCSGPAFDVCGRHRELVQKARSMEEEP